MDRDIEFTAGGYTLNHWPETAQAAFKERVDSINTCMSSRLAQRVPESSFDMAAIASVIEQDKKMLDYLDKKEGA